MKNTREDTGMAADESQKQIGQYRSVCVVDGYLSSQEFGVWTTVSKIQRSSCTPRWHCERRFRIICNIHWTRVISITNDSSKSNVYHIKATRMRRTSSRWQYITLHTQVKMEDASTLFKIPKSECPDIWIRLPKHKWPKSWSSMEDPAVLLERNLYGHPLAGLLWERQFENV